VIISIKIFHKQQSVFFKMAVNLSKQKVSELSTRASEPLGTSTEGCFIYLDELIILHIVQSV
jgi:hypothetical protein